MSAVKQRRDALLVSPDNVMIVNDRRGRAWVTDRFTLVRADLFKQPPTYNRGLFVTRIGDTERGGRATRRLLRTVRFDDTTWISERSDLTDAVGDTSVTWFQVGPKALYLSANHTVSRGYRDARLKPRYHAEQGFITWWEQTNATQHALMAILMPKGATPHPRAEATR